MEAAALTGPAPGRMLTLNVEVDENLGAETFIHHTFNLRPVITPDIEELLADTGQTANSLGDTTKFVARISSDVPISKKEPVDVVVDTAKLYFFDPQTGERIGARSEAMATG
jgi:multiple sugar transport system ATP-binding protein